LHYWGCQQLDDWGGFGDFTDVGESADPANVDLANIQAALSFLPGYIQLNLDWDGQALRNVTCQVAGEKIHVGSLAGGNGQVIHNYFLPISEPIKDIKIYSSIILHHHNLST
jgi:hypothetical protein